MTFDPKVDKILVMDDVVYEIVCLRNKFGKETFEEAEARGMVIQHPVDKTYQVIVLEPVGSRTSPYRIYHASRRFRIRHRP